MAKVHFSKGAIKAIVTTAGDRLLSIDEEAKKFGYDERTLKRVKKSMGFNSRRIVSDSSICTSDLCIQSAKRIFKEMNIEPKSIEGLIMVTQTPDFRAPSTAIIMQDRLNLSTDSIAFDINLGCSGFINGLFVAYSMIQSGLNRILLCVGDVASKFAYERDKTLTPLMGDAGSAILIEAQNSDSFFTLHSDGSGYQHLIIPAGACRYPCTKEALEPKEREDGSIRRDIDMYMNGSEIFNFTIKVVPKMFEELFSFSGINKDLIDYFVLHQANRYILQNIAKRIKVDESRLPMQTVSSYGNQNSASIPGTINGFLFKEYSKRGLKSLFGGFGIGLSWGACMVDTENIFAPETQIYAKEKI